MENGGSEQRGPLVQDQTEVAEAGSELKSLPPPVFSLSLGLVLSVL